ncbi:MAG: hypothetical protein J2P49_03305 [Methylocapsa sp.]|nr:hypothetical protein [Methylocapsa sp.]
MLLLRLVVIFAGTAAYLGLAVLGEGSFAAFFSNKALVALAIALFALAVVAAYAGGNVSPGVREDRSNRWVLAVFGVLGLLAGYLPAYCERIGFFFIGGEGLRWLGVVLFAAGGVLRLLPVFVLKNRFSGLVAIQPGRAAIP